MDDNQHRYSQTRHDDFDFDLDLDDVDTPHDDMPSSEYEETSDEEEALDIAPDDEQPLPGPEAFEPPQAEPGDWSDGRLEAIPVTLEFRLGQMNLSLDELKNLAPDVILHIEGGTTANLAIVCAGQTVGRGEIVSVNGQLGIRVLSWSR